MAETAINLTVIGDRACSTTRTYLTYLRAAGYRPRRLWLVDFSPESRRERITRRVIGQRLSGYLSTRRRRTVEPLRAAAEYSALCLRLQEEAGFQPIDHFTGWRTDDAAEEVSVFRAGDFEDRALQARMAESTDSAFLYTNGGIVPAVLLDRQGIRILHIHPGIVPDLRGSDCLLWSAAARRQLGASCFYMSSGIDEGMLIGQREYGLPRLPSLSPMLNPKDEPLAYRALLFAVDPHLRAQLLVDILDAHRGADLRHLPARAQARQTRTAYLWMHPRLRLRVMKDSFL